MSNPVPAPVLDARNGDQVVAQVISSLPSELSDRSDANPAVVEAEAFGSVYDKIIYQINRWPQAVIQKALSLVGVTLGSATAATVSQSFTLANPQQSDTTIPSATSVSIADGSISFATTSDVTIPAYSTQTGTAALAVGSTAVVGTGTTFQTGTTWVGWQIQIPASTGAWYTIASVSSTTSLTLTSSALATVATSAFNVGPVTASVNAKATSTGANTNVGAAKLVVLSSSPAGVSATTNVSAATGGSDVETTTAAIARAPSAFAARDVAMSVEDYAGFAAAILGSGRAIAQGNTNDTTPASGYVTVGMLSPNWTTSSSVSTLERAAVVRDLAGRTATGSTTIDVAANVTSYTVTMQLYRKANYDENTVRCNVAAAINTYLNPNTYQWGRTIYLPDLVRVAESAAGVDRVEEINGVACVTAAATTTTANPVTFTNGSASATGTAGNFTTMVAGRTILVDSVNKKSYLVTAVSGGTLTLHASFSGATVTAAVSWFNPGDTTLTNWYSLPYSALSTSVSSPPASITVVGSV